MPRRREKDTIAAGIDPRDAWLHRVGVAALAAKLLLVPLAIDPLGEDLFDVPKSVVSRSLMYLLLACEATYLGTSAPARERLRSARWPAIAVIGFAIAASLSTLFAVDRSVALYGMHHRYVGLTSIFDGAVFALGVAIFISRPRDLLAAVGAFLAGAVMVFAYAVVQLLGLDPIDWRDPMLSSTIGNRGVFAGYCLVVAGTAAVASLYAPAPRTRYAALAIAGLAGAFVVASGARGPLLALPFVALTVALLTLRARPALLARWSRRRLMTAATVASAGVLAALVVALPRLRTLAAGGDTSLAERGVVYSAGLAMVLARPVIGSGPDHFGVLFPRMHSGIPAELAAIVAPGQTSAHSWILQIAIDTGILGLAAIAVIVALCVRRAWVSATREDGAAPVIGAAALSGFALQGVFNISSVGTDMLFWLGVGLCSAVPATHAIPRSRRDPAAWPVAVALLVGLGLASTTVNWALANRDVRASDAFRAAGRLELAERAALAATSRDPGRANNWNVLGLARRDRPDAAVSAFARAVERAPYESAYVLNLARTEAELGQRSPQMKARSSDHARMAVDLAPSDPRTLFRAAEILLFNGDAAGALGLVERSMRSFPGAADAFELASRIHEALGDPRKAAQLLHDLLERRGPVADAPAGQRLRLASLYASAGDAERARALVAPPKARAADSGCAPANGSAQVRSVSRPRCFRVVFDAEAPLDRSATDPSRYSLLGRPLPAGSTVAYDGDRAVTIQLPAATSPPATATLVAVRDVRDVYGNAIRPDPAELAVDADLTEPGGLLGAADVLLAAGDTRRALELADRSIASFPDALDAYLLASRAHEALGDPGKAADVFRAAFERRAPIAQAPLVHRLRLAGLYAAAGDLARARSVVAPPAATRADTSCTPTAGSAQVSSATRPRCFRVTFTFEAPLVADPRSPGALIDPATYTIDGRPLPAGTTLTYDGQRTVTIQLPSTATPPDARALIGVRGIRDVFGAPLRTDPTELTLD